ncbi:MULTISPECIES: response regulator transcription factor [unclassified Actinomyces]|uniref:response regulator transcription factor n=1 Tax=unclassified Actinomyces TaxID=2609248 RepID=UPI000D58E041|nr:MULTISPECIES: response regulator transcription factor [unclassified Actinomyces]RAX19827.1 DNA-binding response regulator [Actinomyces sp. Z5]RAX24216.1 DNA-binding response regulator [Actinomyces sp. Z3]
MTGEIGVLVAEDQRLLRASLIALFNAEPDMTVLGEAADGERAVAEASRLRPDVVLMDIRMPALSGIEATARICADPRLAHTRILILSMYELDEYVLGALRAGASGFLLKDADPSMLLDAVRTVHSGQSLLAPSLMARLLDHCVPAATSSTARLETLTPRQREVLTLIARGMSNTEIEEELRITRATRRSHINALLARLGARDRAQLVIAAYEFGLVRPARQGL